MSTPILFGRPIIESGTRIKTTYDISKCYVVAVPRDNRTAMLATFVPATTKDPFVRIQAWLEDNFNPGAGAAAKEHEGVDFLFIIADATTEESSRAIADAYLAMVNRIVVFRVASSFIAKPHSYADKTALVLDVEAKNPLVIGDRASKLGRGA